MRRSMLPWLVPLGVLVTVLLVVLSSVTVGLLFLVVALGFPLGYAYIRNRNADSDSW